MNTPWVINASLNGSPDTSWLWGSEVIEGISATPPVGIDGNVIPGSFVSPLLCDTHTHGAMGLGVTDNGTDLEKLVDLLRQRGVGSVQLSTVTLSTEDTHKVLVAARSAKARQPELIGIHLEGPFLSRDKKGAHDGSLLRKGTLEAVKELVEPYLDVVSAITIDPLSVEIEAIAWLVDNAVTVAVGHTPASYSETLAAFQAGATVLTHALNAMLPIGSREPGPVLAAVEAGAYIEVIADGHHVHPVLVKALFDLAPRRMVLVTDSMSSAGLPDGTYSVGSVPVTISEGIARTSEGNLAGSTVTLTEAVRNVVSWGVSPADALEAATVTPRRAYGVTEPIPAIGQPAELIVWSEGMAHQAILLGGEITSI